MSEFMALLLLIGMSLAAGMAGGVGFAYLCMRKIIPAVDERFEKAIAALNEAPSGGER